MIFDAIYSVVCGIALTLTLSYATYTLIEIPGRRWVRGVLDGVILRLFGAVRTCKVSCVPVVADRFLVQRIAFCLCAATGLSALALTGQAATSGALMTYISQIRTRDRPEIAVVSASYGLNCRTFPVVPPSLNSVSQGNATTLVARACTHSDSCDLVVSV
jgi:hypothetical protein